jgi:hypothetical protein
MCLGHAARRHEDCRCGQGNKLQCLYCETPKSALQGNRMNSWLSSQWQTTYNNTCTGSVHLNITPVGQVQDGNNNCPSYTRNAQSLHQCSVQRQVLTRHHRQQRRLWAQTHHHWTRQDRNVSVLPWPAKSPDLYPIEHVWDLLDRRVRARAIPPRNVRDLAGALVEEWGNISQQKLANLVQSMGRRCTAVLNVAGGHTRY